MTKTRIKNIAFTLLSVLFWIAVWWVAVYFMNGSLRVPVPSPKDTVVAFFGFLVLPEFYLSVLSSVLRVAFGFLSALILGAVFGILTSKVYAAEKLLSPLVYFIRAVPVAAFIFIVYLWMKSDAIPVFISFLMVFPVVLENVKAGVGAVDVKLVEMAKVMGMSGKGILKNITLPSVVPHFSAAAVTGLGLAWKAGVAAEVICRPSSSLGYLLWQSKTAIEYEGVFAVSLTVVLLSILIEAVLKTVIKNLTKKSFKC